MKLPKRLEWLRLERLRRWRPNFRLLIAVVVLVGINIWSAWTAMQSRSQARETKVALSALREEMTREWTVGKLTAIRVDCATLSVEDKNDGSRIYLTSVGRSRMVVEGADGQDRIVLGFNETSREAVMRLFGENGTPRCVIASNPSGAAIAIADKHGRLVNSLSTTD
jgi:hypothetical protein